MKKITKKKMSIEDLALSMNRGFRRVENLIEKKIDGLAISTAKGFESVDKSFESVDKRFDDIDGKYIDYELYFDSYDNLYLIVHKVY